jgi:hypothetical protein
VKTIIKIIYLILLPLLIVSSCAVSEIEPQTMVAPSPVPTIEKPKPKPQFIQVAPQDAEKIGQKIWMNEGAAKVENLTVWNKGETFASLGIGHFIWYPPGQEGPYLEGFPPLLAFFEQQGVNIPGWLKKTSDCPWNSRQAFYKDINSAKMINLRNLLKNTISQQIQFIIKRLEQALPQMLDALPTEERRNHVRQQFYRVAQKPVGVYALVDYINFKGEGVSPKERYQGQGWGLLQVLENMPGDSNNLMVEFAKSADKMLTLRVRNAPKDESRWLPGWRNRLKTYTYDF